MMRAAVRGTAILLAAVLFIAGCTSPSPPQAVHRAGGAWARPALTSVERWVHCGKPWHQPGVRLPAGFVAEAAVECVPALASLLHGHGHSGFTERVADRGLAPLVAALRRPSVPPTPGLFCPYPPPAPVLFLID